ncbi:hypothetical protein DFA_10886 [Cavenderia fasciculata]|uniref:TsaA-like domain-containing protein n=1 Tax=Cavenderia fasciculata TaxID=261658 RepID=F4QBP0_CACFS|nr:uncharacterized protein DFA_10886 [Cavenderia fasciculata]EGG14628.1 hypothetical protein DFA_10886 [Cavenderia fasciculata]|eukprot:XP_004351136.1 hypothetical protein DFA_10886 [Cavenderia fasciculata]
MELKEKLTLIATPALALTAASIASYYIASLKKKIDILNKKAEKEREDKVQAQKICEEQRKGRTRAEIELRRVVNSLKEDRENSNTERPPDYPPIGFLESVYRERNGTPRQGLVVTKGRAILRLRTNINPVHALEGLEQYSHVWLIFVFHENTNTLRSVRQDRPGSNVKAKVSPPRLDGVKVGLFSTRSPHRPNAIGLSAAKIDKIEGNALHLSGIDLIDGTPILDVKPYLQMYDSIPEAINPSWISDFVPLEDVVISKEADQQLAELVKRKVLKFYNNFDDVRTAICQVLIEDIRSIRKRKSDKEREKGEKADDQEQQEEAGPEQHRFCLDTINVCFTVENQKAYVSKIELDQVLFDQQKNIYQPSGIYKGEKKSSINNNNNNQNNQNNNTTPTSTSPSSSSDTSSPPIIMNQQSPLDL